MNKLKPNEFSTVSQVVFKNKKGNKYKCFCLVDTFSNTVQRIPKGEVEYYKHITNK